MRYNFQAPLASIHAVCYTYDAVSRVISNGLVNIENSTISYREAFNYSPAGNIRTVYHNGAGTYEYDTQNKLTSFRDTSFTYDADGNMLTSTLGKFAFDSSNRLINTQTNSGSVTYTYDAEGTRIKSECGEDVIAYTYDVNARLSKLLVKTEGNVTTKYVYGLGLIGEETDGEFKTYHFDLRGSTVAITNEACEVTDTFEYDTYGKVISRTGTSKTPFLYNGSYGVMTEASGLCYMRARYYSPVLKRFINADIVSGDISNAVTLNRYAFANCNPVSNVDPLGLSAERGQQFIIKNEDYHDDIKTYYESWVELSKKRGNGHDDRRPNSGEPGSTYTSKNGDLRIYGPDGKPQSDYDHDDHTFPDKHPHDENGGHWHDWDGNKRGAPYVKILGFALLSIGIIGLIVITLDDATGVGVADDGLAAPLTGMLYEGLSLLA